MTTNDTPPQVSKEQAERNREIITNQRYFNRSRHSRLWTSSNLAADQLLEPAMNRRSKILVPAPKPAPFVHTGFEVGAL